MRWRAPDQEVDQRGLADHWQEFLHQQHFLAILPVDISASINENEAGIEFQYRNGDLTDLMKVGCMHRRQLALMLHVLTATGMYVRSLCEFFLRQPL